MEVHIQEEVDGGAYYGRYSPVGGNAVGAIYGKKGYPGHNGDRCRNRK